MTWGELITAVSLVTSENKKEVTNILSATVDVMQETLIKGEQVSLLGMGSMKPVVRAARKGRNLKTKEPIDILARKTVKLVLGTTMKNALNSQ